MNSDRARLSKTRVRVSPALLTFYSETLIMRISSHVWQNILSDTTCSIIHSFQIPLVSPANHAHLPSSFIGDTEGEDTRQEVSNCLYVQCCTEIKPNLGGKVCATRRLVSASIFASELHYCSRVFSLGGIEFRPRGGEEISQKGYNYSK